MQIKKEYSILGKFPARPFELELRTKNQKKFSRNKIFSFNKNIKLYVTDDFQLILTNLTLHKNDKILTDKNFVKQNVILKNIKYFRTTQKHKGQPFIHYFTGKEKIYVKSLDNKYSYMLYLITSSRKLAGCK